MIQDFLIVSTQVVILFILIAIGFLCGKINFINESTSKNITNIILYIVTPCVIIDSFQREFETELLFNLGITVISAIGIHVLSIIIAHLVFRDKKDATQCVLRFGTVFSNCGFMSIPLQSAILGSEGVFYGAAFVAVFNIMIWSYGLISMSGDKKAISAKKLIINPGVIGVFVGLILFVFSISLPTIIKSPIEYMSMLNTPLPMIIIGYHLSQIDLIKSFKNKQQYIAITLRLVVIPLLSLLFMWLLGVRDIVLVACTIAASAPVAATTTMFAGKFEKDTTLSVNLVSLSTLFSIVTMPLIVGFAQVIG